MASSRRSIRRAHPLLVLLVVWLAATPACRQRPAAPAEEASGSAVQAAGPSEGSAPATDQEGADRQLEQLLDGAEAHFASGDLDGARARLAQAIAQWETRDGAYPPSFRDLLGRVALAFEAPDTGLALVDAAGHRLVGDPVGQALRLRLLDRTDSRLAARRRVDREVRRLLRYLSRRREPLAPGERERFCEHLEALYLDRAEAARAAAHRVDALLSAARVCTRVAVQQRVAEALRRGAEAALGAGRGGEAVTYLEPLAAALPILAVDDEVSAWARETVAEILWPTYLANRLARFQRRFASDWRDRGIYDPDGQVVRLVVEVAPPEGCPPVSVESGDEVVCADAEAALRQEVGRQLWQLALAASEAGEREAPELEAWLGQTAQLASMTQAGDRLSAEASVPLETLLRAAYRGAQERD